MMVPHPDTTSAGSGSETESSLLPPRHDGLSPPFLSLGGVRLANANHHFCRRHHARRRNQASVSYEPRKSKSRAFCFSLLLSSCLNFAGLASSASSSSSSSSSRYHHHGHHGPHSKGRHGKSSKSLYDCLGASKDSSPEQIKKCYRKASLRHHPDKPGGSDEAFKEVARAYQVLSDPEQRALYDRFGEAGLQQQQSQPSQSAPQFGGSWGGGRPFPQQAGGPFPAEFFSSAFFGGGGSAGRGAAGPSFTSFSFSGANSDGSSIDLDLDELMRRMTMMGGGRRGPAAAADHAHFSPRTPGGRQEAPLRRRRKTAAPSSYERPVPCTLEELYSGATKKLRVSFGANKSLSRVFPVEIKPGYKAGTKITFPSSAHDGFPKMVFVVQERPHPVFARRGDDLVYRYKLPPEHKDPSSTLSVSGEASLPRRWPPATTILLTIPLLDGATWTRELDASSSLLRKGRSLTVPDLGMPIRKRGGDGKAASERGNLIIEFF